MIEVNSAMDTFKFRSTKRFLMYVRGPLSKAKPAIKANIEKVNMSTNLSGAATMNAMKKRLREPKTPAKMNATLA